MSKFKPNVITTNRLVLKSITENDRVTMIDFFVDKEITKTYMIPDFSCDEEKNRLFDRFVILSNNIERFVYGIYLEGQIIGFLNDVFASEEEIELGYVIGPKFKNNGYATEVLFASINELFSMGYDAVRAGAFTENKASIRVMEKCKMTKLLEEESINYKNEIKQCVIYEIRK